MVSGRGLRNVKELDVPWRFAPTQTYDPKTNPTGLISFGMAENVSSLIRQHRWHANLNKKPMKAEIAKYINEKVYIQESYSFFLLSFYQASKI